MRGLVPFASGTAALIVCARIAAAQATDPGGPLAQLKDDKQLTETLAVITNDPSVPTDDPSVRSLAQALRAIQPASSMRSHSFATPIGVMSNSSASLAWFIGASPLCSASTPSRRHCARDRPSRWRAMRSKRRPSRRATSLTRKVNRFSRFSLTGQILN